MLKKSFLPTLLALSSLFNSTCAGEKKKSSANLSNVISHAASFVLGNFTGVYGHKYLFSDKNIAEKDKIISEKNEAISEKSTEADSLKKECEKLKKENKELEKKNKKLKEIVKSHKATDKSTKTASLEEKCEELEKKNKELEKFSKAFERLLNVSCVKLYLNKIGYDQDSVVSQRRQLLKWIIKGRCLEDCFRDKNNNPVTNYRGAWCSKNCLNYFKFNGVEGKYQANFDEIFAGEDPVANFDALDKKHKKLFIEMAVKHMLATTLCNEVVEGDEWQEFYNGDTFRRYSQMIAKKW